MHPDRSIGLYFLDIEEKSVWRIIDRLWDHQGKLCFILEHEGDEGKREVEKQWLQPGGHYRRLSDMEVLAWMAR